MPKKGRKTPARSRILPYAKSRGTEAVKLYYQSERRKALEWQKLLIKDIMVIGKDGLWT